MRVDQAIYTSLPRAGQSGYHVVSRSRGVSDADARALTSWSPSHDALILDNSNRVSVNIHPLPEGRLAVSRTCEGPPEYSGRGGKQIYTHAILIDPSALNQSRTLPIALYRDAMALGIFRFRLDPPPVLDEVELGRCHPQLGSDQSDVLPADLGPIDLDFAAIRNRLESGDRVEIRFPGDRVRLAEVLLGSLRPGLAETISLSTSLRTSSARPFRICLVH
jgi:hypothetical protein